MTTQYTQEFLETKNYKLLFNLKNIYNSKKFPPCDNVGVYYKIIEDACQILFVDLDNNRLLRQTIYDDEDIAIVESILKHC